MKKQASLPLVGHLIELRKRLIYSMLAVGIAFLICIYFARNIYHYLSLPLLKVLPENSSFIATHPLEAWLTYLKVAFLSGIFLSSPVLFYQLWRFISPGLYLKEKIYSLSFVIFSSLFFVGGAFFGYFFIFPIVFQYFVSLFGDSPIQFLPKMQDYFAFSSRMLMGFSLIFELPIVVYFLAASGIVSFKALLKFQRYIIVLGFILGAMLTPPDVISQILLAIPIVFLYQVGLLGAWFHRKKKRSSP